MLHRFEQFSSDIFTIYRDIQKLEREEMEKYGLKGAFSTYLLILLKHPDGITSSRLSEICDKDKAAISRVVSEMAAKGLVKREGTKDNLYRANISLTEEGLRVAEFVRKRAMAAVAAASKGLTEENRKIFYAALDLIAANLKEINKTGIPDNTNGETL